VESATNEAAWDWELIGDTPSDGPTPQIEVDEPDGNPGEEGGALASTRPEPLREQVVDGGLSDDDDDDDDCVSNPDDDGGGALSKIFFAHRGVGISN
jgi:hypothetical protein